MLTSQIHSARALVTPWRALLIAALATACRAEEDISGPSFPSQAPSPATSDAAPTFSGIFDAALALEVKVCQFAGCTQLPSHRLQ
jgi:hypothetical protein